MLAAAVGTDELLAAGALDGPGLWVPVGALLLLPLLFYIAVAVKMSSRGPVLYANERIGRDGRRFRMWKFRSMFTNGDAVLEHYLDAHPECREEYETTQKLRWDPRITRIGRFIRKTSLDELPQLWNVLTGDMSLVGPRPERPEFVPSLEQAIPRYRDRLLVRPGLTGLAQVQLPPDTDLESVRRKLARDLYYIGNVSFSLDIRLMIVTGFYLLGRSCAWPCRLFHIPGEDVAESNYEQLVRDRNQASPAVPVEVPPRSVPQTV